MIILNLFSVVGADIMAWERTDLPPLTKVYHSEIDPFAISVDRFLHPQVIQLGDVQNIKGADLGYVDVILGGSPCQGFSYSGKQLAFDDPRSKLFFEFVRILKEELREINPKIHFFLENVKMKKEYRDVITDQLGVHPIELNSALDSAQNRKRLYWASWGIMPQVDKGIMLGDILEDNVEGLDLSDAHKNRVLNTKRGKGYFYTKDSDKIGTLISGYHKIPTDGSYIQAERCIEVGHAEGINGHDILKRVYSPNGKAPTLNAHGGGNTEPKVLCGAFRGRYLIDGKRQDHKMKTKGLTTQRLEVREDGKTNTLTTVQKDNVIVKQQHWRRLSPKECERLMTVEDDATLYGIDEDGKEIKISNTQRYKMLGNGWVIDTIAHCLKYLEGRI